MFQRATDQFRVEFTFGARWCRLYLTVDGNVSAYAATALMDSLGALAHSVADLASGAFLTSSMWGDEPGGVFIDIARADPEHVVIVFHELGMEDWITQTGPAPWLPIRGDALIGAKIPIREFLFQIRNAFEAARLLIGDNGKIKGWGHRYPKDSLEVIAANLDRIHRSARESGDT